VNPIPISDDVALAAAAARLAGSPRLALDTEFMRERTYYAELAFLQLADAEGVVLIDPLAALDRAPLARLLAAPGQVKVLHAARQDVEVLLPITGAPLAPVLDTQLAAALLGFAPQVGYGDLIASELGIALDKSQARTDWTRRPLSPAQLSYAADDVRWLLPLAARLEERLAALGRLAWFHEDTALLADPGLYRLEPGDAWQRFKAIEALPPREQLRLRALAAWREARAMRRNLPRGWVLTDEAARTIARVAPANLAALKALDVMPPGAADKLGADILAALAEAAAQPLDGIVQRNEGRPGPEERERTQRLGERVRQAAGALRLAPEVLATQRDLRRIARGEPVATVLRGWRLATLGPPLAEEAGRG
jgi:ribonuclease D